MNSANYVHVVNRPKTRYQEIPHYAEGLYNLGHNCYAWMVPNGAWGEANAGLIVGDGETALVDTLWDIEKTREMLAAMAPFTKENPLRYVINSHADGDHFFGNGLVSEAEIVTSEAAYEEMQTVKPQSLLLLANIGKALSLAGKLPGMKTQAQVGHWFQNMPKPYKFGGINRVFPRTTFDGELSLTMGGRRLELIEIGPMHTEGDLLIYVPDAKILYAADALFINATPVMWAGPLANWLKALDKILALDVEIIVPGHGPITDKDGVRQVKAYWEFVEVEIKKGFETGLSANKTATQIALSKEFKASPFAQWDSPEKIMTSTYTEYRHLQGNPKPPSIPQLLKILRHQAILANKLPNATPSIMRLP